MKKWLYAVGIVAFITAVTWHQCNEANKKERYFTDLNLALKGEVLAVDLPNSSNGFGIVKVKVLETNKPYYDPRKDSRYYYCIIKDGLAEIYQHSVSNCEPGDTITLDTWKRRFRIDKKDGKHEIQDITLYTNEFFYKYVKERHQRF